MTSVMGFEKIYSQPELIILIYKLLTFRDQLRLAAVCKPLKFIFENFIFPGNFRVLCAVKIDPNNFLISNEGDEICFVLSQEQLQDFALVYVEDVREFSEDKSKLSYKVSIKTPLPQVRVEQFHNLTCLQYVMALIQDEHILSVAAHCPQLRELLLYDCYANAKGDRLQIGDDLKISSLLQMKMLKKLQVEAQFSSKHIYYSVFREFITRTNLESFISSSYLIPDKDATECTEEEQEPAEDTSDAAAQHHGVLKEIKISTSFDAEIWGNKFESFLLLFKNLSILTLNVVWDFTDDALETLAKTCCNLEAFVITGRGEFTDIKNFTLPAKVKEFRVRNCYGLTHTNLRQLLTQYEIQNFSSTEVIYEGNFEDFPISPHIRILNLDSINSFRFPSAYINNSNLKELNWYEKEEYNYASENDGEEGARDVTNAVEEEEEEGEEEEFSNDSDKIYVNNYIYHDPGPLHTCINLETLNICRGYLPYGPILELRHLRKLEIKQEMPGLNWSFITAILGHFSLVEFSLDTWIDMERGNDLLKCPDVPTQGFVSNVKVLSMHLLLLKRGLDFWMDLLDKNEEMTLICKSFTIDLDFIRKLLGHTHLPKDVRALDIWGVSLKCNDMRKDFQIVEKKLEAAINILSLDCEHMERIGRLIIKREN